MAYEKLAHLTRKLAEKTSSGEVDWEETAENGTYQAAFADYSVHISTKRNENGGDDDILITIFDEGGQIIEKFSDEDIKIFTPGMAIYTIMKNMYETARRHALGTEKVINRILDILNDDGIPF